MSSEQDDKTEAPTERALSRAYDEGQLPLARDAVALAAMVGGAGALAAMGSVLLESIHGVIQGTVAALAVQDRFPGDQLIRPVAIGVGIVAAAAGMATAATLAQTRGGIWVELVGPRPDRLFSGERWRRIFRAETWQDVLINGVKLMTILASVWWSAGDRLLTLWFATDVSTDGLLDAAAAVLLRVVTSAFAAMAVLAAGDAWLTRHRFQKRLRMTRDEVKRERREDEGDPLLKQRRKRRHRELVRAQVAVEVPRSDVVVVNPTHFAVALRYQRGREQAPRVTAKGKDALAHVIRSLAREHGVAIVEDKPLARMLYKRVKVGEHIPADMFRAVATVLAFVYRVTGRAAPGGGPA